MRLLQNASVLQTCSIVLVGLAAACSSDDPAPNYGNLNPTGASTTGGAPVTAGGVGSTGTTGGVANTVGGTMGATGGAVAGTTTGVAQATSGGTTGFGTTGGGTAFGNTATTGGATTGGGTTGGGANICDPSLTGEQFYMQTLSCVRCHGPQGQGIDELGPEVHFPSEDYARWIIREGRMDHPDFEDGMEAGAADCPTDAQIDQIIDFLNGFPRPTDGAGLFAAFCANCHGADARGGVTERDLDGELHEIESITPTGAHTDEFDNRSEFMPVMTDRLSEQELDLILDYLQNDLGLAF